MRLTVIADEVTALGWRLIGAQCLVPGSTTAQVGFREALLGADVVLVIAEYASEIPAAQMNTALLGSNPLVMVIADLQHRHEPPEIEREVRRALGLMA